MRATPLVLCSLLAMGSTDDSRARRPPPPRSSRARARSAAAARDHDPHAHTARDVHEQRDYHDRHALARKFYDTAKGGQPVTDKVTAHQYEIM